MIELFWQRSESAIEELEDRQVYRDADYTVYDVTHLFYTDLESYGRNVAARMEAGNAGSRGWKRGMPDIIMTGSA